MLSSVSSSSVHRVSSVTTRRRTSPRSSSRPGAPREGWDHNTAYLRRIVGDLWDAELTVVERELTLAGVNPAMDAFIEAAELLHKAAQEAAYEAGGHAASRVGAR